MINLTITVDNINQVLNVFDRVEIKRYNLTGTPDTPVAITDYVDILGIDTVNNTSDVSYVDLLPSYTQYYFTDPDGSADDWYTSRYINTTTSGASSWSSPIQGESGDLYASPLFPPEVSYGATDQRVIDRIRLYIGDPIGLNREVGVEAASSIHSDGRVYQMDEKGYPASINMYGTQYTSTDNPSVNGYKFLKFKEAITDPVVTISGVEYSIDLWYYSFRFSDREIIEIYDNTSPPTPLTSANCTNEIYMMQASYDLLFSETLENIVEDGAAIKDGTDAYNPEPGLKQRDAMLDKLKKRIDEAVKSVRLLGIGGVLID